MEFLIHNGPSQNVYIRLLINVIHGNVLYTLLFVTTDAPIYPYPCKRGLSFGEKQSNNLNTLTTNQSEWTALSWSRKQYGKTTIPK